MVLLGILVKQNVRAVECVSLVALPSGLGLNVSPSGKHFLVLRTRSGPGDLLHSTVTTSLVTRVLPGSQGDSLPLNVTPGVGVWIHSCLLLVDCLYLKGRVWLQSLCA